MHEGCERVGGNNWGVMKVALDETDQRKGLQTVHALVALMRYVAAYLVFDATSHGRNCGSPRYL